MRNKFTWVCTMAVLTLLPTLRADLCLTSANPGSRWSSEYYPLGNGSMGAMLSGGTARDILQINLDSLWTGDVRTLGDYYRMGYYQNFGNLYFDFSNCEKITEYRRQLNLENATHTVTFKTGKSTVRKTTFISFPDRVLCHTIESEKPLSGKLRFEDAHKGKVLYQKHSFSIEWQLDNRLRYAGLGALDGDGTFSAEKDGIAFQNCRKLRLLLVADTDYELNHRRNFCNSARLKALPVLLQNVKNIPPEQLYQRHIADYRSLFARVSLKLGSDISTSKTTAEMIRDARKGKVSPQLVTLLYQFGRYLLISGSRPGTLPMNLQGIWNDSNTPAWHSDYHTNINLQMNYWGAESANLSECHLPLFDLLRETVPAATEDTRRNVRHSRGFAYRISMNIFGGQAAKWNWPGASWLAMHLYWHYQYTQDKTFLKEQAYPFFLGCAEFWLSYLKRRPDGTWVVPRGWSPEHGPVEDGVAHDQQIVSEFLDVFLETAKILKIDNETVRQAASIRPRLLGHKIGKWGQLQEWETDRDRKGDRHRHTSHLYAVYPGSSINADTPEFFRAARIALEGRALTGDARRSWTWPWRAALWARFHDGAKAEAMVESLLRYNTMPNAFTSHPPFQIDGNLGVVGAIGEMLLQDVTGTIRPYPMDFPGWRDGEVSGLRARGGYTVGFRWKNAGLVSATVKADFDSTLKLEFRQPMNLREQTATRFEIPVKAGETLKFSASPER